MDASAGCGRRRNAGAARAEALCWTVWGTTELHAYMMQWLYHGLDTPVSYAPADRSKATAAYNHGQYLRMLDALEARLAGRDYILGGAFSLADIPAASSLLSGSVSAAASRAARTSPPGSTAAAPGPRSPASAARGRASRIERRTLLADVLRNCGESWPYARVKQCQIKIGSEVTFNGLRLHAWRRGFAAPSRWGTSE